MKIVVDWLRRDYQARTVDELIEILLLDLKNKSVLDQLLCRGIKEVVFLDCPGASVSPKPNGFFRLWLGNDPRTWFMDIGHELAHTFFWRFPLLSGKQPERKYIQHSEEEEEFCDLFAKRWTLQGNDLRKSQSLARRLQVRKRVSLTELAGRPH